MIATLADRSRAGLILAFALFVLLGMPEGVLGTAWPSIRLSLDQPVESLAWLVASYTAGYFVSTVGAGRAQARLGVGVTTAVGVSATVVGLVLYAVVGWWPVAIGASFVLGCGGGTVDAAMNAYAAVAHGPRAMNMLHAMFGVGATGGPLIVTAVVGADLSWRWVYVGLALVESAVLVAVIARRSSFDAPAHAERDSDSDAAIDWRILAPMLLCFVLYVSVEASFGHWSFSVLSESRGLSTTVAGWGVALYWGGLTVGRLLLGARGHRIAPELLLTRSVAGMAIGAAVFWADPAPGADLVALVALGLASAGVFPALVLLTPIWIGVSNTGRAVGYQLAASSAGVIAVSGLLGALVGWQGLGVVAPTLCVLAAAMVLVNASTQRIAAARR